MDRPLSSAAHASLKDLLDRKVLKREILGNQHLYRLDHSDRTVRDILMPAFRREGAFKEDIRSFLLRRIEDAEAAGLIVSLVLYGSWPWAKPMRPATAILPSSSSIRRPKSSWKNSFRTGLWASSFGIRGRP